MDALAKVVGKQAPNVSRSLHTMAVAGLRCNSRSWMRYEGMCLDWLNKVSHSSGGLPRSSIF